MPLPVYVTQENVHFNGTLDNCVLVKTVGPLKTVILWDALTIEYQALFNTLMTDFGGVLPVPASPGFQTVNCGGLVVGGNSTGLPNNATLFYATFIVDGSVTVNASFAGSTAQTYNALLVQLNAALGANATASIVGGNIKVVSSSVGLGSSVLINNFSVFDYVTGFAPVLMPQRFGATGLEEVMNVNYWPNGNTVFMQLVHLERVLDIKPDIRYWAGWTRETIYFGGAGIPVWRYLYNDAVVP